MYIGITIEMSFKYKLLFLESIPVVIHGTKSHNIYWHGTERKKVSDLFEIKVRRHHAGREEVLQICSCIVSPEEWG